MTIEEVIVGEVNASELKDTSEVHPLIVLDEGGEVSSETGECVSTVSSMAASNLTICVFNSHCQRRLHMEDPGACCKTKACTCVHVNPDLLGAWQIVLPVCISRTIAPPQ